MNKRALAFVIAFLIIIAAAAVLFYRLLPIRGSTDIAAAIATAQARSTSGLAPTRVPTATPNAEGVQYLLRHETYAIRVSAVRTLSHRDDIPVARRVELLIGALEAELANPSTDAPRVADSYLTPDGMARLLIIRTLGELGPEAISPLQDARASAEGLAQDCVLVALAYLGEPTVFTKVRDLVVGSDDIVIRMSAARALGVAGDHEAIPVLTVALADAERVEARDSLGEYSIYPVREQAVNALGMLGIRVVRQEDDTLTVEGE